jgi:hypothetical protein
LLADPLLGRLPLRGACELGGIAATHITEVAGGPPGCNGDRAHGITAETNAAKLAEFAMRRSDIKDDIDAQEMQKSRRWDFDLDDYVDEDDYD